MIAILVGVLGLAVGSFLNVLIWRLPQGLSLSKPPSSCPRCGHAIRWYDNVPVLSWLVLGGKCRDCRARISLRYPLVELGAGIGFFLLAWWQLSKAGGYWLLPALLYFFAISIALALIDLDSRKLPNRIVLPSMAVVLVLLSLASFGTGDWWSLLWAAAGGAILFVFYLLLALIYPAGMGFGDVKLAGVIGLILGYLGWGALIVGAFAAFLLGGLFSIGLLFTGKATRKSGIPFGPWMLLGAWVGIIFGREISSWYLALVGIG
ncbi:MAG: prepilin peptidase [Cryobacterium sp.]|nr:prepilin peptidase [Cryobacterium sp.]